MANVELGTTIGGYRVESVAGRGGMGVVYVATQLRLNRQVALKVIASDLADDPGFRERFTHESQIAASLDHPNVIPVHEAGEHEGLMYLSMRYVDGTDLGRLLREQTRLEARRAARIVAQVADALDAAHARGLVHRDVKPGNVLIAPGDRAYLTDFGLTKHAESASGLTKTGQWVGTVDYVAPEQVQGEPVDARTDVYALGCVLFHALAGKIPFPRPNDIARIYAHLQDDPPAVDWAALGVPPAVDAVLRRAMAKDPSARYQSAGDLGRAAAAAAEGRAVAEPERTVAAGSAAPAAGAATVPGSPYTVPGATQALPPSAAGTRALPYAMAPAGYSPPPAGPPTVPPPPGGGRKVALLVAGLLLLLGGAGVAVAFATGIFDRDRTNTVVTQVPTGGTSTGAPTMTQTEEAVPAATVSELLGRYSEAFSNEDVSALGSLFAADLVRRAPPEPVMNRAEALAEYSRQFAQLSDPTYALTEVRITTQPGEATANARYSITDADGGPPATGTIEFHMTASGDELLIDALDIRSD